MNRICILTLTAWCVLAAPPGETVLKIGGGEGWSFLNGTWSDGPDGALVPPDGGGIEYMAVWNQAEYADFRASCRFQFRAANGGARLLFRVKDSARYYALDVPWSGQQNRNRHMWAGIVLADGTPLQRYLSFAMVPGVAPERNRWYQARLEASGPRLRAWIEGRLIADVRDPTYRSGRLGLMGLITAGANSPHFAQFNISATSVRPSAWSGLAAPPPHWITPCKETDPGAHQTYPNLIRGNSGALAVSIPFGNPSQGETRRTVWVRSNDHGRSWSAPEPAALTQGFGGSFVRRDGTWVAVHANPGFKGPAGQALFTFESKDEGKTWSGPKPFRTISGWPAELELPFYISGQPVRLRDGALLVSVYAERVNTPTHPATHETTPGAASNFVFRSTDDGVTWAPPVRCDRNNPENPKHPDRWFSPANFTEIGLAEAEDNVVVGLGRPGPWPFMWQLRSADGGRTWDPAAFAPFPGYCISLTRMAGGALVAVTRFPYLAAHVSYDGGRNWDHGTILDTPIWANHKAVEVEPNVLLILYMGHMVRKGQADDRILRLKVTDKGLEVAR